LPDLKGWAAAQLAVSADTAPAEVRAVFLRRLAQTNFVPPPLLHRAYGLLHDRQPTPAEDRVGYEAALYAEEVRLREEVETFVQGFFDLLPGDRRRRWEELVDQCAWSPPLAARLEALEAGLDVLAIDGPETEPLTGQLVQRLRKIVLARPHARALQRQAWRELIEQFPEYRKAARYVRQACPRLAALEPGLLDTVQRKAVYRKPASTTDAGGFPPWALWPIIVIVLSVIRVASTGPASKPTQPRFTPPPNLPRSAPALPQAMPSLPGHDLDWPFREPRVPLSGVPGFDRTAPYRQPGVPMPGVPGFDPTAPYRQPGVPWPGIPGHDPTRPYGRGIPGPRIPQPGIGWPPQHPGVPPVGRVPGQPNRPAGPFGPP
jgi:hypothetical protein